MSNPQNEEYFIYITRIASKWSGREKEATNVFALDLSKENYIKVRNFILNFFSEDEIKT